MKQITSLIFLILSITLLQQGTFTLPEHQQAIVLQFGSVQGEPRVEPGLHFKVPFIQDVRYFPKRILGWDGAPGEVPTRDKKFIWVDTTARWKISDSLRFYRSVRDVNNAMARMTTIIDGVTKDTVSNYNLIEMVRNSNAIMGDLEENRQEAHKQLEKDHSDTTLEELTTPVESIQYGREKISEMISLRARSELRGLGIELIDVHLRSIAYKQVVLQKVYKRMISEREKIATKIRSAGIGEKEKVLGQLALTLKKIESEAYRKSQVIRGDADKKAAEIYAQALSKDPEYYSFIRNLEVLDKTLTKKSRFILSTDSAFLKLLNKGS